MFDPLDRKKKKKTSTEYQIEQLWGALNQMYSVFNDINKRLIAISQAKIEPEVLAKFMLDEKGSQGYMENFNKALNELIEKKNAEEKAKSEVEVAKEETVPLKEVEKE